MKKGAVLVALGLLSWTVAGSALAGPFGRFQRSARPPQQQQRALPRSGSDESDDSREKDRVDHGEHTDKNTVNAQQAMPHGEGPRTGEAPRNAEAGPGGIQQVPQMPAGRAGARMSLEDRQKLRRQINEAGRSLYTPPTPTGNK